MPESELHKELKNRAIDYLLDKSYFTARTEVDCGYYGKYDAWGIRNHLETMGIEVKVSRKDWKNNKLKEAKIEDDNWVAAEENYILCPAGLIKPEEIHPKFGLLWFDGKRLKNMKKAEFIKMTDKRKLEIIIGFLAGRLRKPQN